MAAFVRDDSPLLPLVDKTYSRNVMAQIAPSPLLGGIALYHVDLLRSTRVTVIKMHRARSLVPLPHCMMFNEISDIIHRLLRNISTVISISHACNANEMKFSHLLGLLRDDGLIGQQSLPASLLISSEKAMRRLSGHQYSGMNIYQMEPLKRFKVRLGSRNVSRSREGLRCLMQYADWRSPAQYSGEVSD